MFYVQDCICIPFYNCHVRLSREIPVWLRGPVLLCACCPDVLINSTLFTCKCLHLDYVDYVL